MSKKFGHCNCCSLSSGIPPVDPQSIRYALGKQKPEPEPFWKHLEEKLRLAEEALEVSRKAVNECWGIISAHELAIRQDSGNTNYEVAKEKVQEARAALEKIRGGK